MSSGFWGFWQDIQDAQKSGTASQPKAAAQAQKRRGFPRRDALHKLTNPQGIHAVRVVGAAYHATRGTAASRTPGCIICSPYAVQI